MTRAADSATARDHPARWPWAVLATFLVTACVAMVLVVANDEPLADQLPFVVAFTMFGVVGALIVSRERRNVIGGLLLYGSFTTALSFLAGELVSWSVSSGSSGTFAQIMGVFSGFGWLIGILPIVILLPLLFPDGRLPSPRWRPFVWLLGASLALLFVILVFGEPTVTGSTEDVTVPNPLYISALDWVNVPGAFFALFYFGGFAVSMFSLFVRFRKAFGIQRQQIKWVAFGFLAAFLANVLGAFISDPTVNAIVSGAGFLAFPASIGIAVLRFRLYDLDVVVRKTLVIGVLAVVIALVYAALVAGGTALLGRDDPTLTIAVAVVLALAFQPARSWARRLADRLVYGQRATPYEVLTEFSERVGDAYAIHDVLPRMAQILAQGTGASAARVWLVEGRTMRSAAAWPADTPAAPSSAVAGDTVASLPADLAVEVRDRGELLGALSVSMPPDDPIDPVKEKLVRDLASQAGLVLRNARLVENLRISRQRLVAAQDLERRRLERNIHDGAQQQLVALAVKARLARSMTERDPVRAVALLEQVEADTQTALDDLRDLARGIYPPLLADQGLQAALESQLRKSTVPATLRAGGVGRYPQEIEAAIYFSCLEALQNVAKHARASVVTIELAEGDGTLEFRVSDDGAGFDAGSTRFGSGLQGIADRLGAIDGDLDVQAEPGHGTVVTGRVPVIPTAAPDPRADRQEVTA